VRNARRPPRPPALMNPIRAVAALRRGDPRVDRVRSNDVRPVRCSKELGAVRREVNDALSSLRKNVENIIDSTDPKTQRDHYINWIARIRRLAQNIDTMPRWIFDLTVTTPLKSRWTEEEQLYYAGAYSIIEEKCTKHSVHFGLRGVDPGAGSWSR
jgi:hypothetical protein